MTKQEFEQLIKEQKAKGRSDEEIATAFAFMFKQGVLNRTQFEAVLEIIGFKLSKKLKAMSDEKLKENILVRK